MLRIIVAKTMAGFMINSFPAGGTTKSFFMGSKIYLKIGVDITVSNFHAICTAHITESLIHFSTPILYKK